MPISPLASARGFPCSAVRSAARSSVCFTHKLYQPLNRLDLSLAVVCCQVLNASLAASIAAVVSLLSMSGTEHSTSPVIGLVTGKTAPDSAPTQAPFTYALSFSSELEDMLADITSLAIMGL